MRDTRLDRIRALAILMVILVHTWALSGIGQVSETLSRLYHVPLITGVPLFVMLSGALVLGAKERGLGEFYRRRYARLLVPFFVWSALVYGLSCVTGKYPEVTGFGSAIGAYVPRLVGNRINEAYWYVQMIAVLYLLTPFLRRMLRGATTRETGIVIAVGLAALAVSEWYPAAYWNRFVGSLLYYLLYYLFGYWACRTVREGDKKAATLCGLLLIVGIAGVLLHRDAVTTWVESAALFGLMLCLPGRPVRILRAASDCSYATYLTHFILISPLYAAIGWDAMTAPVWQAAVLPIATAVLILTLCTAVFWAVGHVTALCPWLGISKGA